LRLTASSFFLHLTSGEVANRKRRHIAGVVDVEKCYMPEIAGYPHGNYVACFIEEAQSPVAHHLPFAHQSADVSYWLALFTRLPKAFLV